MGKHLKLGGEPSGQNWMLPDDTDLDRLRTDIAEAMGEDDAIRVEVVLSRNQTAELLVNGGTLVAALVWEDSPSDGGMTIID